MIFDEFSTSKSDVGLLLDIINKNIPIAAKTFPEQTSDD